MEGRSLPLVRQAKSVIARAPSSNASIYRAKTDEVEVCSSESKPDPLRAVIGRPAVVGTHSFAKHHLPTFALLMGVLEIARSLARLAIWMVKLRRNHELL